MGTKKKLIFFLKEAAYLILPTILVTLLKTVFNVQPGAILWILIYSPFIYLLFKDKRQYQQNRFFQYNQWEFGITERQKIFVANINTVYLEQINNFQKKYGQFNSSNTWVYLWAAYIWVNAGKIKEYGLYNATIKALNDKLLDSGIKSSEQILDCLIKYWKELDHKFTSINTCGQEAFAKYLTNRLYITVRPELTTPVLKAIDAASCSTDQLLADAEREGIICRETSQKKELASTINSTFLDTIAQIKIKHGAFHANGVSTKIYAVFLWANAAQLYEHHLFKLMLDDLPQQLNITKNNDKIVKLFQEIESFYKELNQNYSLSSDFEIDRLCKFILVMAYEKFTTIPADKFHDYLYDVLSRTRQILLEDEPIKHVSTTGTSGLTQTTSQPIVSLPHITFGSVESPSASSPEDTVIIDNNSDQHNTEPTAAAPSDPEISIVADTHANQQNEEQANNEKQETQTNQVNRSNGTTSSKHSQSGKFCRHCGNMIDPETKKCTGCGKQYFHLHKIKKQALLITLAAVLVLALIGLNIYQYIDNKNTQSLLQNQLNAANQQLSNTQELISSWRNEYHFYHDNAVIVQSGDTNYHKYGCGNLYMFDENGNIDYMGIAREQKDIANMNLRIYSIDTAESNGYAPCPVCYDISSDFDEWLAKKKQQYYSQNP